MKNIPSIIELNEDIANDLRSKLGLTDDDLKKVASALPLVLSAPFKLAYLFLGDIQNNIFPDTASTELNGGMLERLGRLYLNRNPFPATVGEFTVSVTGVAGSVLRENLTFKSNEDALSPGEVYVLDYPYTLNPFNVPEFEDLISIRSLNAGSGVSLEVGDNLTITEPVFGVEKTVTVTEIQTPPADGETEELYRLAILTAIQLEPQGGSKSDYRIWASDVQGLRSVYPYVRQGEAGTVDVYVENVPFDSIDGNGTPSSGFLELVEEAINFDPDVTKPDFERARRPMQANVVVSAITPIPVDVYITGLNDNTQSVRDAIIANITSFIYDVRPYIDGADLLRNKNDILYLGKVQSVVTNSLFSGNFFETLDLRVANNSVTSYEFGLGNIPYFRNLYVNL
jgi:uncharacterized phage protein gp47/JayE